MACAIKNIGLMRQGRSINKPQSSLMMDAKSAVNSLTFSTTGIIFKTYN